jgi:hypothetical protein
MRGLSQLLAVVVVGAVAVTGPAAPGAAGGTSTQENSLPVRIESPSDHDDLPFKQAVATCPQGRVFGAGALVVGGEGGVVLTAMEPNPALSAVTVEAAARTDQAGEWSVVAIAVCDNRQVPLARRVGGPDSPTSASASCPDGHLTGMGFRVLGPVAASHLVALRPSTDLRQVRVRTGGPDAPDWLIAYAICQGTGFAWNRVEAESPVDGTWPKVVDVGGPSSPPSCNHVYGVGGAVDARYGFLTGLVPHPEQQRAWVQAERATPASAMAAQEEQEDEEEEESEDSVTGYVIQIGIPYC